MPGQYKPDREADTKSDNVGCNTGSDLKIAIDRHILLMEYKIEAYGINKDVKHSISTTASEVAEGLSWYPPGKRPVKEINNS